MKAVAKGDMTLVSLTVDPKAVDPQDVDMLQDLVISAVNGALQLARDSASEEMGKITGTGCQLSGMMTAFVVANPDHKLEAAAAAVCAMGLAGEIGWSRMAEGDGNSTYRNRIIDAIYNMDGATLNGGAKYELR